MQREFHPLANLFPLMSEREFAELKSDIQEHGLREPIWLREGQVVDGRNRYLACSELGIEPAFREWDGQGGLTEFVVSLNLHRRHLSESQRAMVADRLATMKKGDNQHASIEATSQSKAAEMLNVSRSAVQRAHVVREHGVPELSTAVESGNLSVNAAAAISRIDKQEQAQILKLPPAEVRKAVAPPPQYDIRKRRNTPQENLAASTRQTVMFRLIDALESLAAIPVSPTLYIQQLPGHMYPAIAENFDAAEKWFLEFREIWRNNETGNLATSNFRRLRSVRKTEQAAGPRNRA